MKELQKYINVDVYGSCGNFSCRSYPHRCIDYNTSHLFYLAFENSLCLDYLTEKTYKVMNDLWVICLVILFHFLIIFFSIILVIYSGADISRFLPPKSYIDANSFESVQELGEYLEFLTQNPKEYVKYFWWKNVYKVTQKSLDLCEICSKLNDPNLREEKHVYPNINKWFSEGICTKPKIKF